MVEKVWEVIKIRYCEHVRQTVALEAEKTYPPEIMGFQSPRLEGHRCSNARACMGPGATGCVWSGGNPLVDPFRS